MTDTPLPAMVVADTDGVICFWSQGAKELTGHPAESAVGQSLDLVVPPEYRERHWAGFRAAMASGTARFEGGAANIPVLCADGSRTALAREVHAHPRRPRPPGRRRRSAGHARRWRPARVRSLSRGLFPVT